MLCYEKSAVIYDFISKYFYIFWYLTLNKISFKYWNVIKKINLLNSIFCDILFSSTDSKVFIIDENGKALSDVIGPLNEGSRLSLLCETNGGIIIY